MQALDESQDEIKFSQEGKSQITLSDLIKVEAALLITVDWDHFGPCLNW